MTTQPFEQPDTGGLRLFGPHVGLASGPNGCGAALEFAAANSFRGGSYALLPSQPQHQLTSGSVDFWLWLEPEAIPSNAAPDAGPPANRGVGVLVRDAFLTERPGHLALLLNHRGQLVLRIQAQSASKPPPEVNRCSRPVPLGQWVHVAFNFGPPAVELFIDGQIQNEEGIAIFDVACGGSASFDIAGNDNPWVLGADATPSDEGSALPQQPDGYLGSARIDHLRIASERYASQL